MIDNPRRGRRLAAWIAAAGCGLWLLAQAVPADAQAARTRPGGSSSSSSSASRGGGSSASSGGGSSSSSSSPTSISRTRPSQPSGDGSPTVIDKRRPRPPRGRGGIDHPGHFHFPHYRYGWWTGWSWWYPWGYPYGYRYPGYGYGYGPPVVYPHQVRPTLGALDTDVWPARTEVWINGQYVGFVDQFDGFPRFLWLEKGTYDVVFYYEGFKTLARQYTIYPGLVIDVEDRLVRGEAIHPNELAPKETPRRDARVEEERERRAAAGEPEWRRRVRSDREAARERPEPSRREAVAGDAWLYLSITPPDAAVYLDGRFLGTARELSDRDTGIAVSPGRHELSVVRPGYGAQRLEFDAEEDGQVDLEVDLEEAA